MAETQSAQNPDSFVKYKQMHKEKGYTSNLIPIDMQDTVQMDN